MTAFLPNQQSSLAVFYLAVLLNRLGLTATLAVTYRGIVTPLNACTPYMHLLRVFSQSIPYMHPSPA